MILLICGFLKNGTNELIYRTEIEPQMKQTNLWLRDEGRDKLGNRDQHAHITTYKIDN